MDKFYSKSSFVIDEEYGLGLSDESFFRQVVPMIKDIDDSLDMPYYGTLITLTNHTPWSDASEYSDYDFSAYNLKGSDFGTRLDDLKEGKTDDDEQAIRGARLDWLLSIEFVPHTIG